MGIFAGIEDAVNKQKDRVAFIEPGNYKLKILMLKEFMNPNKLPRFKAEFEVVESDNELAHPVGSRCDYMICFEKHPGTGDELRAFMEAVFRAKLGGDYKDSLVTQENCIDLVDEDKNPAAGLELICKAYPYETKNGAKITKQMFQAA